jgi:hypothetical protein
MRLCGRLMKKIRGKMQLHPKDRLLEIVRTGDEQACSPDCSEDD